MTDASLITVPHASSDSASSRANIARNTRIRAGGQAAWDAIAWIVAIPLATILRYDLAPPAEAFAQAFVLGILAALAQIFIGYLLNLYRGRYRFGSFDEVFGVTVTATLTTALAFLLRLTTQTPGSSRSVPLIGGALALGIMLGGRFALRAYRTRSNVPSNGERTLIYGAGDSGAQILEQMLRHPDKMILLDRSEFGLHGTQLSSDGRALLDAAPFILADTRDAECMHAGSHVAINEIPVSAAGLKDCARQNYTDHALAPTPLPTSSERWMIRRFHVQKMNQPVVHMENAKADSKDSCAKQRCAALRVHLSQTQKPRFGIKTT